MDKPKTTIMSPKEKAEELVKKYFSQFKVTDSCFGICMDVSYDVCDKMGHGCGLWNQYAKECAIICVEQIIDQLDTTVDITGSSFVIGKIKYWKEVLDHIKST